MVVLRRNVTGIVPNNKKHTSILPRNELFDSFKYIPTAAENVLNVEQTFDKGNGDAPFVA